MANIMKIVADNYNTAMASSFDPVVDTWFLMGSPITILLIAAAYLIFVLKIGPWYMSTRPAFQLKNTIIWYNAIQVVLSIALCVMALRTEFYHYILTNSCNGKDQAYHDVDFQRKLLNAGWWYVFAKMTELLDTVFFVLKKNQRQVTFLHVYHHTLTATFSWIYLKWLPGEQGLTLGFLNSCVHVVMYTYYLLSALGPQYKKYLWWKKYVTTIQLVQFGIMFVYLMLVLAIDCTMPRLLAYWCLTNVIIFMYLFGDFYRKSYSKKNQA